MSTPRAMVGNAADRDQVNTAQRKVRTLEREKRANLLSVLHTKEGRAFIWAQLDDLGVYRSIWDPSSRIHYNAGRQDAGHELMAQVIQASPQLYIAMETEARERARRLDEEIAAARTPSSTDGEQTNG